MGKKIDSTIHAVKASVMSMIMMLSTVVLCFVVFYVSASMKKGYYTTTSSMMDSIECEKAISNLKQSSDYLTSQTRLFALSSDLTYVNNYFKEVNQLKGRENSVYIVEMTHKDDLINTNLLRAYEESLALMKTEMYSMKLVCLANKIDFNYMQSEVRDVQISQEDLNLSAKDQITLARDMLYSSDYMNHKDVITYYSDLAVHELMSDSVYTNQQCDKNFLTSFFSLRIAVLVLGILCIVLFVYALLLVFIPLGKQLKAIQNGTKMEMQGSYELQYIARSYNMLCEKNSVTASVLKHKARRDSLTGLIVKEDLIKIQEALKDSTEKIVYIRFNIDSFEKLRDEMGTAASENILKRVSLLLTQEFRNSDYVGNLDDGKFAIIMVRYGNSIVDIINKKFNIINKILGTKTAEVPSVSLSAGVSFSDDGFTDDVKNQAEAALEKMQNSGSGKCNFFSEDNLN